MQTGKRSKAGCRGGRPLGPSPLPPGGILDRQAQPAVSLLPGLPPGAAAPPPPRVLHPACSAPPAAPFALIHPSIHQTSSEPRPPRPGASFAGRRRTKQSPGGSQRIPGLGLALPPTPAHLLLSPGLRPSTSTLLSFPGRLRPLVRWSESRAASHALMVQAGSSSSWACAVCPPPTPGPHSQPQEKLGVRVQSGLEGTKHCLPGHLSPLSSVPPQSRNEPGRTPSTPDLPREGASPLLVMENSHF